MGYPSKRGYYADLKNDISIAKTDQDKLKHFAIKMKLTKSSII